MKKLSSLIVLMIASIALLTACTKQPGCTDPVAMNFDPNAEEDDASCTYYCECGQDVWHSGAITSNETWTSDHIYELNGKVIVESGVTLTIEPGTIIKGQEGTGSLASMLIVAKGGKINAIGTAQQPIIFTSVLDNIQPGQLKGSNLEKEHTGLWGGIAIMGKAPVSTADGDVYGQLEGIPVTDVFGAYGGADQNDDSGIMQYVCIRHTGALIGAGNETAGLTLAGVGNGTSISEIEIYATEDDGLEIFGGTVEISNVAVGFQHDDAIQLDQNFDGSIANFTLISDDSGDESIEADGAEGSTYIDGMFALTSGTIINEGTLDRSSHFKDKPRGIMQNIKFNGDVKISVAFDGSCQLIESAYTNLTDPIASLIINNCERDSVLLQGGTLCNPGINLQQAAESEIVDSPASGSNSSVFNNWTILSIDGWL